MPRKRDIPQEAYDALERLRLRLRLDRNHPFEVKVAWFEEVKRDHGQRTANIAMWLLDAGVPINQTTNIEKVEKMEQKASGQDQSVSQTAGRDMTGVNASGKQTIRDIITYTQDLNQSGAVIGAPVRTALIEAREGIEKADIDSSIKPMLMDQFDKLTEELKKGDDKNPGTIKAFWTVIYNTIKAIPAAATCYTGLDKLAALLAPYF